MPIHFKIKEVTVKIKPLIKKIFVFLKIFHH
jgi:hypothetical protein